MAPEALSPDSSSARGVLFTPWGLAVLAALVAGAIGLSQRNSGSEPPAAEGYGLEAGQISLLTYNVAGLPAMLSQSQPNQNHPLISPRLGDYDIALVQEDFAFHEALAKDCRLPFHSLPGKRQRLVNDGLNRFSRFEFAPVQRERWRSCNGLWDAKSDCLADKGYSWSRTRLSPTTTVDIYNLHADSGGEEADFEARREQFEQLADAVLRLSSGHAVIIAGDTNLSPFRDEDGKILSAFLQRLGLKDLASVSQSTGRFAINGLDRIFYRSVERLTLLPVKAHFAEGFTDPEGRPLSDHRPLAAEFQWSAQPTP